MKQIPKHANIIVIIKNKNVKKMNKIIVFAFVK